MMTNTSSHPASDSAASKARATRNAIIDSLKRDGPQSANNLAEQRKLTPMAVRLHLYDLHEEGLVDFTSERAQRGRPTKIWCLTDASSRIFPDAHQGLALEMISSMTSLFGEEGLKQVVDKHAENQCQRYKATLKEAKSLSIIQKLNKLAELRTNEGYIAEVRPDGDGFLFLENHCPICSAAQACQRLCSNELSVFKSVLGDSVEIDRIEHILTGARRCAYRVTSK
ncbi:helix-turn-helix transcriptional regulator [Hirschia baltica]|uniref:Putative transcriptional regulator n=1 Tax=Hirschia baltica (strain ATCC 49814 / DSM 5838 / IFAM 1418) TaxID=582402 RepID=C6XM38_HIRBI|nr:metalloregulator ArsR/SmtB family transcription factor [Hirschia baltica]ACT59870.1 putative transcriptional regulator [Hirschia baltica ATCC 49814]